MKEEIYNPRGKIYTTGNNSTNYLPLVSTLLQLEIECSKRRKYGSL